MARDEFERNKNVKDIVSFTYRVFANGRGGCGWRTRGESLILPGAVKTWHCTY